MISARVADGSVRLMDLVTHRAPVADAADLFSMVDRQPESVLQAVLDFRAS
jgi:hypothetical protein